MFSDVVGALGWMHDTVVRCACPELIGRSVISVRSTREPVERLAGVRAVVLGPSIWSQIWLVVVAVVLFRRDVMVDGWSDLWAGEFGLGVKASDKVLLRRVKKQRNRRDG